jgi:hypothetical protein
METVMNMISVTRIGRCDALVDALRAELGGILAERVLEVEAADFLWDSRVRERYLGQHIGVISGDGEPSEEVSRVAILSLLDGRWYAGICLVDVDGAVMDLLWKRAFESREEAEIAFVRAR